MRRWFLAAAMAWGMAMASAPLTFDDPAMEARFQKLTRELRCLVCQNQSLADSHADLAQDLRREVYEMMQAGKSDQEIVAFLVNRYGDFVLYRPPVKPATYLLWYGPAAFALAGLAVLVLLVRRRRSPPEVDEGELDEVIERLDKGDKA